MCIINPVIPQSGRVDLLLSNQSGSCPSFHFSRMLANFFMKETCAIGKHIHSTHDHTEGHMKQGSHTFGKGMILKGVRRLLYGSIQRSRNMTEFSLESWDQKARDVLCITVCLVSTGKSEMFTALPSLWCPPLGGRKGGGCVLGRTELTQLHRHSASASESHPCHDYMRQCTQLTG